MTAYTDFHYSPTGSGVISGAQVLEQTEQGINGLGQYVQDNVSGAIDTANQALTIAQTADSNATLALNTANSFASAISAANNTANNALTTAQSAQNTANTASSLATTANNNANTALNAANTATSNVATLTGTVNSLGNRMTTAENAISTNAGNITTLQTNLQTTNNNVTAAANAASSAQATATSAQSTATLARNQAYVLRYTGTTITGGGTIAYADIDNTDNIKAGDKIIDISGAIYAIASVDIANQTVTVGASPVINLFCDAENLIPAANDAYDLGSSSYQWNNLYAKNYFYNGTAWGLDQANVWSGSNRFIKSINLGNITSYTDCSLGFTGLYNVLFFNTRGSSNIPSYGTYVYYGYSNASSDRGAIIRMVRTTDKREDTNDGYIPDTSFNLYKISPEKLFIDFMEAVRVTNNGTENSLKPITTNTTDLGTSTLKWKTLNGINPGALSLPNYSDTTYIDISGSIVPPSGETTINYSGGENQYTPPVDGWLSIRSDGATFLQIYRNAYNCPGTTASRQDASGKLVVTLPVLKNTTYTIRINTSGTTNIFQLYPCLGNV